MTGLAVRVTAMVKVDVLPSTGAVAVGALAIIVGWRSVVAGLAVDRTTVVKADVLPAAGVVAVRAPAVIVEHLRNVALFASRLPAMVEHDSLPAASVVAPGALAGIVTGRCIPAMAVDTIAETQVIEPVLSPIGAVVAVGA